MRTMYIGKITITLKSDLCTGSGYSFAGIIDQDVCYDKKGLPFIPGKRLKGCIRETAVTSLYKLFDESVFESYINNIFGRTGDARSGRFRIDNAYIKNYEQISQKLETAAVQNPEIKEQNVLRQYTRVIGQTALTEKGGAEKESLRYTRVVNHYNLPLSEKKVEEMVFVSEFTAELEENEMKALEKMILATRNIGLKRNRGMGSIVTSVEYEKKRMVSELESVSGSEKRKQIPVTLKNIEPLMLSGEKEDSSETYISARSLIGVLAGCYLNFSGTSPDSKVFEDLFLNGTVIYSCLYPSKGGKIYYPVPEYINKLKKTKKLVNILDTGGKKEAEQEDEWKTEDGNLPKKIKGAYYRQEKQGEISLLIPEKDIIYHHSHHKLNADGQEGILYGMEVLSAGQEFTGIIELPDKYCNLIMQLLEEADFVFGKSRSTQYGKCKRIINREIAVEPIDKETLVLEKYQHFFVTCLSDLAVINSETKDYTIYEDQVRKELMDELFDKSIDSNIIRNSQTDASYLKTGLITGYNTSWNLRMQPIPCIKAGSAFVMTSVKRCEIPQYLYLGERNTEGFGKVCIQKLTDMQYKMQKSPNSSGTSEENSETKERKETGTSIQAKEIVDYLTMKIHRDEWISEQKRDMLNSIQLDQDISASGISRLTLMLKESLNEKKEYKEQFEAFEKRVESIKSKQLKESGRKLAGWFAEPGEENEKTDQEKQKLKKFGWLDNTNDQRIVPHKDFYCQAWGECLMSVLVLWKYEKAGDQ